MVSTWHLSTGNRTQQRLKGRHKQREICKTGYRIWWCPMPELMEFGMLFLNTIPPTRKLSSLTRLEHQVDGFTNTNTKNSERICSKKPRRSKLRGKYICYLWSLPEPAIDCRWKRFASSSLISQNWGWSRARISRRELSISSHNASLCDRSNHVIRASSIWHCQDDDKISRQVISLCLPIHHDQSSKWYF